MNGDRRRWLVPALPFVVSLGTSLATASPTVFWQDSGFFLTAVHELSVLYPPGFVLYLVLCKAWTVGAAPIFGFTSAVHLFSALCAAGTAAFLASASRVFLKRLDPGSRADVPAAAAGCLLAAGYSFGAAAILAKPYALFYLSCAALIWLMAVAEGKRGYLAMAGILGLCWAAHPSGALLAPAAVTYGVLKRQVLRAWGWGFVAGLIGVAAAAAFLPSLLLLPLFAAKGSVYSFGDPRSAGAAGSYLIGERFVSGPGAFQFEAARWVQGSRFVWEEYLGIGLVLLGLGAWRILRKRSRALFVGLAWVLPVAGVTLLFRAEGQFDLWLVSIYLPLTLVLAAGIQAIPRPAAALGVAAAGLAWMLAANLPDLNQRHYPYAELYGRLMLRSVAPGAPVLLTFDDSIATVSYLQSVKGERADVGLVIRTFLGLPWYDRALGERPGIRVPDWERSYRAMPGISPEIFDLNAFANANAGPGHPVFLEQEPDRRFLRPGLSAVPSGMLWKIATTEEAVLDPAAFEFGVDLPGLLKDIRRPRGVVTKGGGREAAFRSEPFEHRLVLTLLHARLRMADFLLETSAARALEQYDLVRQVWPAFLEDPRFLGQWGRALFLCGKFDEARAAFGSLLRIPGISPRSQALARLQLGEIALAQGRREEARAELEAAARTGALDAAAGKNLEERLRRP